MNTPSAHPPGDWMFRAYITAKQGKAILGRLQAATEPVTLTAEEARTFAEYVEALRDQKLREVAK